jgi:hypothetical protein
MNEQGLNFLLDQRDPSERRKYVVRRLISCGGEGTEPEACTRLSEPATVMALGERAYSTNDNGITLLHELGHQVGLLDGPDPRSLTYRGRPTPRAGTRLNAAEVACFGGCCPCPETPQPSPRGEHLSA